MRFITLHDGQGDLVLVAMNCIRLVEKNHFPIPGELEGRKTIVYGQFRGHNDAVFVQESAEQVLKLMSAIDAPAGNG